jgi:uncharacterized damage-inducible protein DinB
MVDAPKRDDRQMDLLDYFRRQFAYHAWANQEVLAAIRVSPAGVGRSLELFAHILSAERLWLERLRQTPPTLPVWPQLSLGQCEAQALEMSSLWREYLDEPAGNLSQSVTYKNSKCETYSSTAEEILTHVILHSAYHRGQIASHIRDNGQTPAYTDFIHGVRQGLIR